MPRKKVGRTETLADCIKAYWQAWELRAHVDRERPMGIITNHLEPFFGRTPLVDISIDMVQTYLMQRKAAGASTGTLWRELRLFKCLMAHADARGWVSKGKFRYIHLPSEENRERIASTEELARICLVATSEVWDVCCVALHTGLRLGAILSLKSGMIHGDWVAVPKGLTRKKVNCPMVPMTDTTKRVLERYPRGFERWGTPEAFGRTFRATCAKAEIEGLHFHDLRHTFATWLTELGVDYLETMYLMGHKVPGTAFEDYSHANPKVRKKLLAVRDMLNEERKLVEKDTPQRRETDREQNVPIHKVV